MSRTLTLEIPEDAYDELVRTANRKGQPPERVAVEMLADRLTDPVMRLAGCLSMPYADIAKHHDEYVGAGLLPQPDEKWKGLFVDTAGWAAFLVRSEAFHDQAVFLLNDARENGRPILTTSYVMTELVALLTSPMRVPRREQVRIIGTLRSADWIRILHVDPAQDDAAWRLLARHEDKTWSLVDCSSFVVMREQAITVALTTDRHFEQAGFTRLLRKQ